MSRSRIAIYHPLLTNASSNGGGATFRVLHGIESLRNDYDVTLVTEAAPDWAKLNRAYGTSLTDGSVGLLLGRRHLGVRDDKVFLLPYCGRTFDLCVSGHNISDFRVPAVHFLANCRFDAKIALTAGAMGDPNYALHSDKPSGRFGLLRRTTKEGFKHALALLYGGKPRTPADVIKSPGERIVCNSHWMAKMMMESYDVKTPDVLYPPVVAEFRHVPWPNRHSNFVCVARVAPEKKVEQIIEIVQGVRNAGFDFITLHLAGRIPDTSYGRKIQQLIDSRPWIRAHGDVFGKQKEELISSCRFALHACAIEAFGISVAEYMKAGVIPFIPDKGATPELVPLGELQFGNTEMAIAKIMTVLKNDAHQLNLHNYMIDRGRMFTLDAFRLGFRRILDQELARRGSSPHTTTRDHAQN